jgi:transcriptional regulator with XRE-family HTH domain
MNAISELHTQWLKRPKYKKIFIDTQAEHELAQKIIRTRINSGLSQQVIAKKMGITLASLLRVESGSYRTSIITLIKFAIATNTVLLISFESLKHSTEEFDD